MRRRVLYRSLLVAAAYVLAAIFRAPNVAPRSIPKKQDFKRHDESNPLWCIGWGQTAYGQEILSRVIFRWHEYALIIGNLLRS